MELDYIPIVGALIAIGLTIWLITRPRLILGIPRRIVITGAASGLGKASLAYLISKGDFVVALDVNEEALDQIRDEFGAGKVLAIKCDVNDSDSLKKAVETVRRNCGEKCIDAIVNFAGLQRTGPLVEMADFDFELVFKINVFGTFKTNKAFFPLLKRDNPTFPARIINTASEVSLCSMTTAFSAPYTMSKLAVESYSVGLRQEMMLLEVPVHVVVLNPGAFKTALTTTNDDVSSVFGKVAQSSRVFKQQLLASDSVATSYIARKMKSPIHVAKAVFNAVHLDNPPYRITVNVSSMMRLAALMPQFILDLSTKMLLNSNISKTKE